MYFDLAHFCAHAGREPDLSLASSHQSEGNSLSQFQLSSADEVKFMDELATTVPAMGPPKSPSSKAGIVSWRPGRGRGFPG
jgi:hypothetical protein